LFYANIDDFISFKNANSSATKTAENIDASLYGGDSMLIGFIFYNA
jgi:iron complex outermembrane receptor protein